MKYSAIDLHSNNNVLVVTDESDREHDKWGQTLMALG